VLPNDKGPEGEKRLKMVEKEERYLGYIS